MKPLSLLGRVLRSWRSWVAPAAGCWALLAVVVGAVWTTGIARSPLGPHDPRAGETGSFFDGLESSQIGPVGVALGVAGVLTSLILWRLPDHWPAVPAIGLGIVLIVVIPDGRVIQNFAYLFFGVTHLWDAGLAVMLISMMGGLLFMLAGLANLSRGQRLLASLREPRWAVGMTYAAVLLALPYAIVRIAWGLGIPLGVPGDYLAGWGLERLGVIALGCLPVAGAILTIGLLRPWGEIFPRWIPVLAGRRVPIWFAVVPGMWAAAIITSLGLRLTPWTIRDLGELSWNSWGEALPGLFSLPWGITLAAAVFAYAIRRQGSESTAIRHEYPVSGIPSPMG